MRKLFAAAVVGALVLLVASPALADRTEPPRVRLILPGEDYQLKYPPSKGPQIPTPVPPPGKSLKPGNPGSDQVPLGIPVSKEPGAAGAVAVPAGSASGTLGTFEVGGVAGVAGGGGAGLSDSQKANRSLKRLIRDLG